jgi:hypothetical protein
MNDNFSTYIIISSEITSLLSQLLNLKIKQKYLKLNCWDGIYKYPEICLACESNLKDDIVKCYDEICKKIKKLV